MDEGSSSSKEQAAEETLSSSSSWRPSQGVFGPYLPVLQPNAKPQSLRVVVRRPVSVSFSNII